MTSRAKPRTVDASVAPMIKSVEPASATRFGLLCETTRRRGLMRALLADDGGNGLHQYLQVSPRRPRVNVAVIQAHPLVERNFGAAAHLPKTCDALRDAQTPLR